MKYFCWCAVALALLAGCDDNRSNDAGPPVDAGASADARAETDAGADTDAGTDTDAGSDTDAGAETDAGASADAGAEADAGAGADAGAATDAGMSSRPARGELVIVEIQGNPQVATDEQAEYFEVVNVSGRTLDLSGVRIAHVDFDGGEPVASRAIVDVDTSVLVAAGERALFARSGGGYFGGVTPAFVYGGFVFDNGATHANRLRLMSPTWNGSEPPEQADVIDEVITLPGMFDNPFRGRALQLDPGAVSPPNAAANDDLTDWCYAPSDAAHEYRTSNWGTPGAAEDC